MQPQQPPEFPDSAERHAWLLRTLRAAVGRSCPGELVSHREDLVQTALVRVLELEGRGEQNQVRTASYLWRVAFSVIADELRRRRSEEHRSRRATEVGDELTQQGTTPVPELAVGLRECIARLPEPRRLAVLLHLEGFRAEEASRVLHWDVKRIQNLTYRGLADLRRCLERRGLTP